MGPLPGNWLASRIADLTPDKGPNCFQRLTALAKKRVNYIRFKNVSATDAGPNCLQRLTAVAKKES